MDHHAQQPRGMDSKPRQNVVLQMLAMTRTTTQSSHSRGIPLHRSRNLRRCRTHCFDMSLFETDSQDAENGMRYLIIRLDRLCSDVLSATRMDSSNSAGKLVASATFSATHARLARLLPSIYMR